MTENQVIEAEIVSAKPTELAKSETKSEDKLAWLSESEKYALTYFRNTYQKGGSSTYSLAPSIQAQLFSLYLNGRTLNEIRQLNHPSYSLGQIVDAAIQGDWYNQKLEYQNNLLKVARERLQQIGCESVNFLADSLAAAHKLHGESLQKFLQTGNPADLGAFGIGSIRQYKETVELLTKLTGQDKTTNTNLNIKGTVEHVAAQEVVKGGTNKLPSLAELAAQKKAKESK